MTSKKQRAREETVLCYCYSACTHGVGRPKEKSARTREVHLAADKELVQQALTRELEPDDALLRAVDLNETAISLQDQHWEAGSFSEHSGDERIGMDEEEQEEELPDSQNSAASRRVLSWAAVLSGSPPYDQHADAQDDMDNMPWDNAVQEPEPLASPYQSSLASQRQDLSDGSDVIMDAGYGRRIESSSTSSSNAGRRGSGHDPAAAEEEEEEDDDDEDEELEDVFAGFGLGLEDEDEELDEVEEPRDQPREPARHQEQQDEDADEPEQPPMDPGPFSTHWQLKLDELVGTYRHGPQPEHPPQGAERQVILEDLPPRERASLRHFRTRVRRKLTDRASVEVAADIEDATRSVAPNEPITIMSKYKTAKYVGTLTKLKTSQHDMCINSCMAFVGEHADLERCTAKRDGEECGEPRFDNNRKPRKRFTTIDLLPRVRLKFAVGARNNYGSDRLMASSGTIGRPEHIYQDYWDGQQAMNLHWEKDIFVRRSEEAYSMSIDGVQVEERKESNGWIILLTCLSSPPEDRYRRSSTFVSGVVPGPKNPVDIDSFLWPVMQEFARASKGFWVWNGPGREWFLWRAYLVFASADQPGSQKINRMTGTSGFSGCRDCHMIANYSGANQVAGYFPLGTTGKNDQDPLNVQRPDEYDPYELPLRSDATFAEALEDWDACLTDAEYAQVRRDHGVSGRPLLAASPAFSIPWFFPSDIFHLFGMNLPSLLWSALTDGEPGDPFTFSEEQKTLFADMLKGAGKDLPAAFSSGLPRDPFQYANSHYKMFEWTLVTYHYLLPFLLCVGAPVAVLNMVNQLYQGVYLSSSDDGCTEAQRQRIQQHFVGFVDLWEANYVRGQSVLVHRSTISVHYLLHIADFIRMHGSVRISSQARCEREAGLMKDDVRSRKKVFENITNTLIVREHLRLLDIILDGGNAADQDAGDQFRLTVRIRRDHLQLTQGERRQLTRCVRRLEQEGLLPEQRNAMVQRGRVELPSQRIIRSSLVETKLARRSSRFMAQDGDRAIYGEALLFFCFPEGEQDGQEAEVVTRVAYVLARPLLGVQTIGGITRGTRWGEDLFVIELSAAMEPVGILDLGGFVYVLRKLSWTGPEE